MRPHFVQQHVTDDEKKYDRIKSREKNHSSFQYEITKDKKIPIKSKKNPVGQVTNQR